MTGQQFLRLSNSVLVEVTDYTYACRRTCGTGQVVRGVLSTDFLLVVCLDTERQQIAKMKVRKMLEEAMIRKAQIEDDPKKLSREGKPVVGIRRIVSSDERINLKDGLNKRKW